MNRTDWTPYVIILLALLLMLWAVVVSLAEDLTYEEVQEVASEGPASWRQEHVGDYILEYDITWIGNPIVGVPGGTVGVYDIEIGLRPDGMVVWREAQ